MVLWTWPLRKLKNFGILAGNAYISIITGARIMGALNDLRVLPPTCWIVSMVAISLPVLREASIGIIRI